MELKIINLSHNPMPDYKTEGAAGMDLMAHLQEPITIQPLERQLIPTGIKVELPAGYEGQVRPRSGLALKNGITVLNAPGTIDADFRGEIGVVLINLSKESFQIHSGDRIAQLVIAPFTKVSPVSVEMIGETKRGENGYGHTGK